MSLKKSKTPDASVAEDLTASALVEQKSNVCKTCEGKGILAPDATTYCPDCNGSGTIKA